MLSARRGSMPVRPVARAVSETPSRTHRRSVASRSSSALSASLTLAWLRTCAARSANLSVDSVSEAAAAAAETHATRVVLQFPPNESSKSRVSFESRYGMWAARPRACVSALITLPGAGAGAAADSALRAKIARENCAAERRARAHRAPTTTR